MNLTLATKQQFVIFFFLLSHTLWCQVENNIKTESKQHNTSRSILNGGVKGSFGASYNAVIPSGDKYVGLAYKGKGGFALKFKLFVYNGFFVGGSVGSSYFDNNNVTITGNYDKTHVSSKYFFLGYEYRPTEKLAIGISTSVYGESRYKNEYHGIKEAYQIDHSKVRALEASIDYFIAKNFSINLYYIYRNDKTNIKTSSNLEPIFDRAQFSTVGIGFNLQFGKDAIISKNKN